MTYILVLTTMRGQRIVSDPMPATEDDASKIEETLTEMVNGVADGASMTITVDGRAKAFPNHAIESMYWTKRQV